MTERPASIVHRAVVVRFRAEVTVVKFLAPDGAPHEMLSVLAAKGAEKLDAHDWSASEIAVPPHVVACASESEEGLSAARTKSEFEAAAIEGRQYMLLTADTRSGEGEVIAAPWLCTGAPDLLSFDILTDWREQIEVLIDSQEVVEDMFRRRH